MGRPRAWDETGRRCVGKGSCGRHRPLEHFRWVNSPKLQAGGTYRPQCRECEWKLRNPLGRRPRPTVSKAYRNENLHRCPSCGKGRHKTLFDGDGPCAHCLREVDLDRAGLYQRWYDSFATTHDRELCIRRLRKHSLSPERYQAILEAQGHACGMCGDEVPRYDIDHDHACCDSKHSCGECVRGLICWTCNRQIGNANDSVERMQWGIVYVQGGTARERLGV